jgi:hypothetical protein
MTGTVRSKALSLDFQYSGIGKFQTLFSTIANVLDIHPGCSRIASNYGKHGLGFGPARSANVTGNNAWGVWRFNSSSSGAIFDVAITVGYGPDNYTTAVSGVWASDSNTDIGFAMAWHSSSAAWGGTTNNNGNDIFTTGSLGQPWKSGSLIFPHYNTDGQTNGTKKNGVTNAVINVNYDNIIYISVDNDGLYFIVDSRNVGSSIADYVFYLGSYETVTSSNNVPLVMGMFDKSECGLLNSGRGGISNFSGVGSRSVREGLLGGPFGPTNPLQTNSTDKLFFTQERNKFYEFPIMLFMKDASVTPNYTWFVGKMHSMYFCNANADIFHLYNSGSRMTVRSDTTSTGYGCVTIPWQTGVKLVEA